MTLSFAMIVFGAMLVYAGWKNRSLAALARGDNQTGKPAVTGGGK